MVSEPRGVAFIGQRPCLLIVTTLMATLASTPAYTQDGAPAEEAPEDQIVEPSPAQLEMNQKAIEAVQKKNFDAAITFFKASLELAPLNITYLNMGRTYQRMGECVQAKEIYRKARITNLKVADPTPADVDKVLNEYEAELHRTCVYGELSVTCDPDKLDLYLNTRKIGTCPAEPMHVEEGEYVIRGSLDGYEDKEIPVRVERVQRAQVTLSLAKKAKPDPADIVKAPDHDPKDAVKNGLNPDKQDVNVNVTVQAGGLTPEEKAKKEQEEVNRRAKIEKRRRARVLTALAGNLIIGGALYWDICPHELPQRFKNYGWTADENTGMRFAVEEPDTFCGHTMNMQFDTKDVIPISMYAVGGGLLLFRSIFLPPIEF